MSDGEETSGSTPAPNRPQPQLAANERVVGWVILRQGPGTRFNSCRVEPVDGLTDLEYQGIWSYLRNIFGGHHVSGY